MRVVPSSGYCWESAAGMSTGRRGLLEGFQLVFRVDVGERVRLIVEQDLDDLEPGVPSIDLAPSTGEKFGQARQHGLAAEAEHRMWLVAGFCDSQLRSRSIHGSAQARDEIEGQERRIARRSGNQTVRRLGESPMQPGQRSRKSADLVGDDFISKYLIFIDIL